MTEQQLVIVDSVIDPESMMFVDGLDLGRSPTWSVGEAVKTFFPARSPYWLRLVEKAVGIETQRSTPTTRGGARRYDLRTIEQLVHRLAESELITADELIRILTIAKCIGVLCKILPSDAKIV